MATGRKELRVMRRIRRLWMVLQAENLPRLALFFLVMLLFGAVFEYLFEVGTDGSNIQTFGDAIWWGIVTMATVGYGDRFPITTGGRWIGTFVILMGVGMVGIFTGKIASILVEQKIREGRGLIDVSELEGHFIICGWKSDMQRIIEDILIVNDGLKAEQLVLVNNASEEWVQELRTDARYRHINFVKGDFIDPSVLRRANMVKARKVLVLADGTMTTSDQEIDARTVMTIMTIHAMTRTIYSCAEVIDPKFKEHLRLAGCDEIILSREYSRFMLVNASASAGISNIIHSLLDVRTPHQLRTTIIPDTFVGKTFSDLAVFFKQQQDAVLIGLLENTGNPTLLKREALREAQKTPDISKLIDNLHQVRAMEPNRPVINPSADYQVRRHSMAIVVG